MSSDSELSNSSVVDNTASSWSYYPQGHGAGSAFLTVLVITLFILGLAGCYLFVTRRINLRLSGRSPVYTSMSGRNHSAPV